MCLDIGGWDIEEVGNGSGKLQTFCTLFTVLDDSSMDLSYSP